MYAKNGDRRVPAGMTIPENYGGNAFAPRVAEAPPPPPAPPSESGCECRREPPAPPCNEKTQRREIKCMQKTVTDGSPPV